MTIQLRHDLETPAYHLENTPDLPVSEVLTSSMAALKHYVEGMNAFFIDEDFEAAAQHWENAAREDHEFAYAKTRLYDIYSDLNRRDSAEKAIRSAMKLQYKLPERYQFHVRNGYYSVQGDWQGAFENAQHWVDLYPNATQGRYTLANHYQRMNKLDAAIAEYKRILEIDPGDHDNLRNIGFFLGQKGEYNEALKYYEQYADLYPDESDSFTGIGNLYRTMGDHEQAKFFFKKALLIEPEKSTLVIEVADTEMQLGNFERASLQYQNALSVAKIPQERKLVYESLSDYYQFRGQMDKSIEYWDLTVAEMQEFAPPIVILLEGRAGYIERYVMAGKEDMARKIVKEFEAQAHQLSPPFNQLSFLFELILIMWIEDPETGLMLEEELGKLETFIQAYNWEAFRWVVCIGRGKIARYREDYSQAMANYQEAIKLVVDREARVFVISRVGRCRRELGELEEAKETLQKGLKLEPFHPEAHYELALVYWEQDKKQQAMEHLKTALYVWEEADAAYKPAKDAREKWAEWESVTTSN